MKQQEDNGSSSSFFSSSASSFEFSRLVQLPDELLATTGSNLAAVDFAKLVKIALVTTATRTSTNKDENDEWSCSTADATGFSDPRWPRTIRLLVLGKSNNNNNNNAKTLLLPEPLKKILHSKLHTWQEEEETKALTPQKFQEIMKNVEVLFRYSEWTVTHSKNLGAEDPYNGQVSWPMGVGFSSDKVGGWSSYKWPPFILSTPTWEPKLLSLDLSPALVNFLQIFTFVRQPAIEANFHPGTNVGVLSWHGNDEEFLAAIGDDDRQMFVQHKMFAHFSPKEGPDDSSVILVWTTHQVMKGYEGRSIISERMQDANNSIKWLNQVTIDSNNKTRKKHSLCFWQIQNKEEDDRETGGTSSDDASDHDLLLGQIHKMLSDLQTPPPLLRRAGRRKLAPFVGKWKMMAACRPSESNPFSMPEGDFFVHLSRDPHSSFSVLNVSTKVCNSISVSMVFLDGFNDADGSAHVKMPGFTSTMMFWPSLDDFEEYVVGMLSRINRIELNSDRSKLTLIGSGGHMVLERQASDDNGNVL